MLRGLQMAVIALVANATLSFGRSSLTDWRDCFLALSAAAALGLGVNPVWVIGVAAAAGSALRYRNLEPGSKSSSASQRQQGNYMGAAVILALVVAAGLAALFFASRRLCDLGLVMLKVDFLAFGGGYASVPLMLHEVCETRHWLDTKVFADGIALGQVTPGPIVITATFIGYEIAGLAGAIVSTIAVFSPSLFVLLLTEPYFDRLQRSTFFRLAVRGILASFVGLLLFATLRLSAAAPWTTGTTLLAFLAFVALRFQINILWVVLLGALAGTVLF
jgi:chromate transporter